MTIMSRCPPEASSLQLPVRESDDSGLKVEAVARLTVSLPRNLLRQFRLHALEQDTTLSALLARLIREELGSA